MGSDIFRSLLGLACAVAICGGSSAMGKEMVWVDSGMLTAPIVVPLEDPTDSVFEAANDLADYVERISGSRPEVLRGAPDPLPDRAVWVGMQSAVRSVFSDLDIDFRKPEEILIVSEGGQLLIAGRDRGPVDIETYRFRSRVGEFGTANAVSTFIHDNLGVRWLWPGELGTDVPSRDRIAFEPFVYRFNPPIMSRRVRVDRRGSQEMEVIHEFWEKGHRMDRRSSHVLPRDHAYNDWSDRFADEHPEYFALRPDGTRSRGYGAKLCVSNPAVARQWVENQVEVLRDNPGITSLGATPNDGAGWCICEECQLMDHPDAPRGVLTERYVKYWNSLASGLRERLPGHEVFLDVLGYSVYRMPPIDTPVDADIAVTYAGHYPLTHEKEWQQTREYMLGWKAAGARHIGYRPNMHWYDGGFWGMPSLAMAKTHDLFKLLAEIDAHVFEIDSVRMYSGTQGPQHYLMARLAYDPSADGHAILRDFYERGFGPAADEVEEYFELMEAAHVELVENPAWRISSSARFEHLELLRQIHTPERLDLAREVLERAKARAEAEGVPPVYAERVAFVRTGLEFVALNMEAAAYMERVRRTQGGDREALERALEISAARDALLAEAAPYAVDISHFQRRIVSPDSTKSRRMGDYIGPPRQEYIDAEPEQPTAKTAKLAVVHHWREDFSDDFEREELGGDWQVLAGDWKIEGGLLTATGNEADNILMLARPKPGLQRIEFVAASVPPGWEQNPEAKAGEVCDLTALIHMGADQPLGGYTAQFGTRYNTANVVRRNGPHVLTDATAERMRVEPGRFYTIVAEFDGRHVRMSVDGETILEYEEEFPLLGSGHDHIGIYSYSPMQVKSVRVFTAEAREEEFYDDPDTN